MRSRSVRAMLVALIVVVVTTSIAAPAIAQEGIFQSGGGSIVGCGLRLERRRDHRTWRVFCKGF